MNIRRDWSLKIDVDAVLRGQGADAKALRARSPQFVTLAERAIEEGRELMAPVALYRTLEITDVRHENIHLQDGGRLSGPLIAQHLAPAQRVHLALCTIGDALETRVSELFITDPLYALALDGLGTAATEALSNELCHLFGSEAASAGLSVTIPLSPGMIDWPVDMGQPQIFASLPADRIGVKLTPTALMIPKKSLTMVVGVGTFSESDRSICDFCSMAATCRYRDHSAQSKS